MLRNPRVYADTSVFGGVFDDKFAEASRAFFELVRRGRMQLVISAVVEEEIAVAPPQVQALFDEMLALADVVPITEEARTLREAYLNAGIVNERSSTDALHVAQATVEGCTLIVSWNFRHIVPFQRIPMYNAINVLRGFGHLAIHSPSEVLIDEDEDV